MGREDGLPNATALKSGHKIRIHSHTRPMKPRVATVARNEKHESAIFAAVTHACGGLAMLDIGKRNSVWCPNHCHLSRWIMGMLQSRQGCALCQRAAISRHASEANIAIALSRPWCNLSFGSFPCSRSPLS
jgi:hypothetical protein